MVYENPVFLEFQKADPGGILFFSEVYNISHVTFEKFVQKLDIPWNDFFNHSQWATPIKHSEADYFKPLRAGTTIQVQLQVSYLSDTSFALKFNFIDEDNFTCATVKTVHSFVDKQALKKTAMPADVKTKLSKYLFLEAQ